MNTFDVKFAMLYLRLIDGYNTCGCSALLITLCFVINFSLYMFYHSRYTINLDYEWNDKYIDFTMVCVFYIYFLFLCVPTTISSRNYVSIFNFSIFIDGKVNLVGNNFKFSKVYKCAQKNKKKK